VRAERCVRRSSPSRPQRRSTRRVCPRTTNALGVGQYAARGKLTSSVTAEVVLPYNLPYKSRHLPSSAIVARLHRGRSGRVAPSPVTPSNPLYRFHTDEVHPVPPGRWISGGVEVWPVMKDNCYSCLTRRFR
jgi:hypothetical protein